MQQKIIDILTAYAARLASDDPSESGLECARKQGWIDEKGNPTEEGKKAAKAFMDQADTRSVFRIG